MPKIKSISAREILDSRGRPTIEAKCELQSGASASASVPSGASTGASEALELRDGDAARYEGLGCRNAVSFVNGEIARTICGQEFETQSALDEAMIDLDGTTNKSRLGANSILSVSLAFARAVAQEQNVPLYQHFSRLLGSQSAKDAAPDSQSV